MTSEWTDERRKARQSAAEKCSDSINRAMFSLLGVASFCLLTIVGSPDARLVTSDVSIRVPFTEAPMSFLGFLLVAPLLLGVLTIYLHIFYGHWLTLDADREKDAIDSYPSLFGMDGRAPHLLTAFVFYWLTPIVLATITWKAAARFEYGLPAAIVTAGITTGLALLIVHRGPGNWRCKTHAGLLAAMGLSAIVGPTLVGVILDNRPFDFGQKESWERPLNLVRADFKGAQLMDVRFHDADLSFANLEGATLRIGARSGADLHRANLSGANLRKADFAEADLSWARLAHADMREARLQGTHLSDAFLLMADLTKADLTEADLRRADLTAALLLSASLAAAKLNGAKLSQAKLKGADLGSSDLTDAKLDGALLADVNMDGATFTRTDFTNAILRGANLGDADLRDVRGLTCKQARAVKEPKIARLPDNLHCPSP